MLFVNIYIYLILRRTYSEKFSVLRSFTNEKGTTNNYSRLRTNIEHFFRPSVNEFPFEANAAIDVNIFDASFDFFQIIYRWSKKERSEVRFATATHPNMIFVKEIQTGGVHVIITIPFRKSLIILRAV